MADHICALADINARERAAIERRVQAEVERRLAQELDERVAQEVERRLAGEVDRRLQEEREQRGRVAGNDLERPGWGLAQLGGALADDRRPLEAEREEAYRPQLRGPGAPGMGPHRVWHQLLGQQPDDRPEAQRPLPPQQHPQVGAGRGRVNPPAGPARPGNVPAWRRQVDQVNFGMFLAPEQQAPEYRRFVEDWEGLEQQHYPAFQAVPPQPPGPVIPQIAGRRNRFLQRPEALPVFEGKETEDVFVFIQKMQGMLSTTDYSAPERATAVRMAVRGAAASTIYYKLMDATDWDLYQALLREWGRCKPEDIRRRIEQCRQQEGESVQIYLQRLEFNFGLAGRANIEIQPGEALSYLRKGLTVPLWNFAIMHPQDGWDELVPKLIHYDRVCREAREEAEIARQRAATLLGGKGPAVSTITGGPPTYSQAQLEEAIVRARQEEQGVPNPTVVVAATAAAKALNRGLYDGPTDFSWATCHSCGEKGHIRYYCPKLSEVERVALRREQEKNRPSKGARTSGGRSQGQASRQSPTPREESSSEDDTSSDEEEESRARRKKHRKARRERAREKKKEKQKKKESRRKGSGEEAKREAPKEGSGTNGAAPVNLTTADVPNGGHEPIYIVGQAGGLPCRVLIDTGAGVSLVNRDWLKRSGVRTVGERYDGPIPQGVNGQQLTI
ncbi:MAG: retropepsin-like aspartic protease, partial [Sulfobacillus sp.]